MMGVGWAAGLRSFRANGRVSVVRTQTGMFWASFVARRQALVSLMWCPRGGWQEIVDQTSFLGCLYVQHVIHCFSNVISVITDHHRPETEGFHGTQAPT